MRQACRREGATRSTRLPSNPLRQAPTGAAQLLGPQHGRLGATGHHCAMGRATECLVQGAPPAPAPRRQPLPARSPARTLRAPRPTRMPRAACTRAACTARKGDQRQTCVRSAREGRCHSRPASLRSLPSAPGAAPSSGPAFCLELPVQAAAASKMGLAQCALCGLSSGKGRAASVLRWGPATDLW